MAYRGGAYWGPAYWGASYFGTGAGTAPAAVVFEAALMAALKADATLSGIVGPRVFPVALPQSATLPALYFRIVSRNRPHTLDAGAGVATPRVQFGACSLKYSDIPAMRGALRALFDGFAGSLGAVTVTSAWCAGEMDLEPEDYGDGSGRTFHHRALDFQFQHDESVPTPATFAGSASDLESALVACVAGDATISALVGDRIYAGMIPRDGARPAIWYRLMKVDHEHTLDAAAGTACARWRWGVQARDYGDAAAVAELLRLRFQGFSGQIAAVSVTSGIAHDEHDDWIAPRDGSSRGFYERSADFEFQHNESV